MMNFDSLGNEQKWLRDLFWKKLLHGKYRMPTVSKIMMTCRFLGQIKTVILGGKDTPRFETKKVGTNPRFILIFHIILCGKKIIL